MAFYVYVIRKMCRKIDGVKEGDLIVTDKFEGKTPVLSYYDRDRKEFRRLMKMEFLLETDADIWTEEGKRLFEKQLREQYPMKSMKEIRLRYFPKSEEKEKEEAMKDPKKAGEYFANKTAMKLKRIMEGKDV